MRRFIPLVSLVAVAACSNSGSTPKVAVDPTPPRFEISTVAAVTQSLPPNVNGYTGSVTIPQALSGDGFETVGYTTSPPPGTPATSTVSPPASLAGAGTSATPIAFVSLSLAGGPASLTASPAVTITAPAPPLTGTFGAGPFGVYLFDRNAAARGYVYVGPALVTPGATQSLVFASLPEPFLLTANDTLVYAIFAFAS